MHHDSFVEARAFRLFVSSTFLDMGAERDHLVRHVFPQIRARAWRRRVAFQEIDLRWGITAEEAQSGAVTEICLAEIARAQPFFMALLGTRYGTCDDTPPEDLPPHLAPFAGRSITELEIRHAAWLAHAQGRPPGALYLHKDAPTAGGANMAALIGALPELGFTPQTYDSAEALGAHVLRDLDRQLDTIWPEARAHATDAPSLPARLAQLQTGYVPRPAPARKLHRQMRTSRKLVLFAPEGAGKSALLAALTLNPPAPRWMGRKRAPPLTLCSASLLPRGATWRDLLATLSPPDETSSDLAGILHSHKGPLVLDDLDHLWHGLPEPDLAWLDVPVPKGANLTIATARRDVARALQTAGWRLISLPPLARAETAAIATRYLEQYGKRLSPADLATLCQAPAATSPAALHIILDDLRVLSEFERLPETLQRLGATEGLYAHCCAYLNRLRPHLPHSAPFEIGLPALALSRAGLSEDDLLSLLSPDGPPLPYAHWRPLRAALDDHLRLRDGRLELTSQPMRAAILDTCAPTEEMRRAIRLRLAHHAAQSADRQRAVFETPFQAALAGDLALLDSFLADPQNRRDLQRLNPDEARRFARLLARHGQTAAHQSAHRDAAHPDPQTARSAAEMLADLGALPEARAAFHDLAQAPGLDPPERVSALLSASEMARRTADYTAASAYLTQAASTAQTPSDHAEIQIFRATLAFETHRPEDLAAALDTALDTAANATLTARQSCLIHRLNAQVALLQGDLRAAKSHAEAARAQALALPAYSEAAAAALVLSQIARRQNRDKDAARALDEAEGIFRRIGDPKGTAACAQARAHLAIRAGDYDAALDCVTRPELDTAQTGNAEVERPQTDHPEAAVLALALRAEIYRRMGATAAATRDLSALSDHMTRLPPYLAAELRHKVAEIARDLRTD